MVITPQIVVSNAFLEEYNKAANANANANANADFNRKNKKEELITKKYDSRSV